MEVGERKSRFPRYVNISKMKETVGKRSIWQSKDRKKGMEKL